MSVFIRYIEDCILSFLQKRCGHPPEMVAADVLEGGGETSVAYCRRCGAVRVQNSNYPSCEWRNPLPHLWRG